MFPAIGVALNGVPETTPAGLMIIPDGPPEVEKLMILRPLKVVTGI